MSQAPAPNPTVLERALDRERAIVVAALLVAALSWAWIVPMARDMYGAMNGPSAWMMTTRWDAAHVLLLFAMWAVMMIGMMLPSAAPTLLLYARVVRHSPEGAGATGRAYLFAAGYLVVWTLFAAGATALQRALSALLVLSPMMELEHPLASAALLLTAGAYQLTAFKRTCLESCRSPVAFITRHWRPGDGGAWRMGLSHGFFCLGCCWALMLLLFVGGVMNLTVIALITVFVLVEKLAPFGVQGGRFSGVLLVAASVWVATR